MMQFSFPLSWLLRRRWQPVAGGAAAAVLLLAASGCTSGVPGGSAAAPAAMEGRASLQWATIGHSVQRRPIEATTLGRGDRRMYLIGLIHGDEAEGLAILPDVLEALREPDFAGRFTVRVVRDMNPDGSAGGTRGNARGVDLNRNWPARNFTPSQTRGPRPLSEPETLAVYADLLSFKPEMVVVFHSTRRGGPFVNFDGPAEGAAELFADAAARLDPRWRTQAEMEYATPGSLGTYIGVDRQIPILTVEFNRGEEGDDAAVVGLLAALRAEPGVEVAK